MDAIDRKLIEDAACAAGWTIDRWGADNKGIPVAYRINERGGHSAFQPLYENGCCDCMGDALRLAVKLDFYVGPRCVEVFRGGREVCNIFEDMEDPYAATRRAIVRAAASIGQQMEK